VDQSGAGAANPSFPIVGVGASAGGLEAFNQMLGALPEDTGMAFVFIQHLVPTHTSMLAEILARSTSMPVSEVSDEPRVLPNHVFVIPPNRNMIISEGKLKLYQREQVGQHRPIDVFLTALAEDQGNNAIGVVLSGTASDGTLGLQAIKAEGGITFAQDESAQHQGMPRSAFAAGCVDFVLPPQEIAKSLARIARHPLVAPVAKVEPLTNEQNLEPIIQVLRNSTGVDFTQYKTNTLRRRITRRMVLHEFASLVDYAKYLQSTPAAADALFQDILISVTSFFRDPEAFEALKTRVFPLLLSQRSRHEPLRVWVLGCATGEEAYSIAMAYTEFAETAGSLVPMQIFATDLNSAGIEKARAGIYPKSVAADISPQRLRRFFVEIDGSLRVSKAIREMCVFAKHNLLSDPPFSRMDLISCRNVLIYLDSSLQQKVIPILHYALRTNGVLWLGRSETIGAYRDLFEVQDNKNKIYSKKAGGAGPLIVRGGNAARHINFERKPGLTRDGLPFAGADPQKEADRILLNRYVPPAVLVNSDLDIIQFRGETGYFLTPAPGRASLNLFKMAREGLLMGLQAAMHKASKHEAPAREEGLRVRSNGGYREVNIEIIPVRGGSKAETCFLVLFEDLSSPFRLRPTVPPPAADGPETMQDESSARQLNHLTQELAATREYLQSVIEQQEAANEELQSANEEIQSTNEELQSINEELETSKEEIQSSNEELATVNDELQNRNQELGRTNNDLFNLLSSVQLPIVMLGADLRLRRFTPMAEKLLNLIPADVGRPISDIKLNLQIDNLEHLVADAIDTITVHEQEVQDKSGHWYSLRIRPYRTTENKIEGAVIVLVDFDRLKRAHEYAESIITTVAEPLLVIDQHWRIQRASRSYYQTFQTTAAQTEKHVFTELDRGQWNDPELRRELQKVIAAGFALTDFEIKRNFERIGQRTVLLTARRLEQSSTNDKLVLVTIKDISERKQLEESLSQRVDDLALADRHKNEFLAMLAHELRNPLAPLSNAVQVLKDPELGPEQQLRTRTMMARQIQNMTRIIDDLLDVSRITQGTIQLRLEECNLGAVLARVVEMLKPLAESRGQELRIAVPPEPVVVEADATRLEQVFVNIITNACKFTGHGGHIEATLQTEATQAGKQAVTRIRDDGIGITPDMLPRIFDLFTQADRTLARTHGGLGIGLTLVQRLVELHGGKVQAFSDGPGKGSMFEVRLPLMNDEKRAGESEQPSAGQNKQAANKYRILVVDDSVDAAESLAMLLRMGGHKVETAYSGSAALAAATANRPDVILLDIGLPGIDGYEVAKELRQRPGLDKVLLVALTGYGKEEDRQKALLAGFDVHLTKPADPEALQDLLAEHWPRVD